MSLAVAGSGATSARGAFAGALAAFGLYAAVASAYTWPLVTRLADVVPHDLGDPVLNTWILWWNAHHLPLLPGWWDPPVFFPMRGALALSEHLAGLGVVATPVQMLGGGPQLAYNLTYFLSFPLSALAAFLLVLRLTQRSDAAFLAGLAFAFNPYRVDHLAHLQVLAAWWMPVALLALHGYLGDRRARWLGLFAVAWLLQAASNGYYLFYFSVLVALWLLWFVRRGDRRRVVAVVCAWAAAALPLVPIVLKYREVQQQLGLGRSIRDVEAFSADVASFFAATSELALWGGVLPAGRAEGRLFPGLTLLLLVVLGSFAAWRRLQPRPAGMRRLRAGLLAAAIVLLIVAASPLVVGPWQISLGSAVVSVSRVHKPLTLAFVTLAAFFFTGAGFRSAYRHRSAFAFYLLAALFLYLCALGPTPSLSGAPVLYKAPYAWFIQFLPGFEGLRVPARFAMPAILCTVVAGAFAFARLTAGRARARLATAIVAAGILVDGWPAPVPLRPPPAPVVPPSAVARRASVLELPLGTTEPDVGAQYRGMAHGRPVVNGYSGYMPPHYFPLMLGLALQDHGVLDVLARYGPVQVFLDPLADAGGKALVEAAGARWLGSASGREVYLIGERPPEAGGVFGPVVPIASITANVNGETAFQAVDGRLRTSWRGRVPQDGTEQVDIDLGGTRTVAAVALALGIFSPDVPADLAIETSEDGATWRQGWRGVPAAAFMSEALVHPVDGWARFALAPRAARYVRLRQLRGGVSPWAWSIAEVQVLGASR